MRRWRGPRSSSSARYWPWPSGLGLWGTFDYTRDTSVRAEANPASDDAQVPEPQRLQRGRFIADARPLRGMQQLVNQLRRVGLRQVTRPDRGATEATECHVHRRAGRRRAHLLRGERVERSRLVRSLGLRCPRLGAWSASRPTGPRSRWTTFSTGPSADTS